MTLVTLCLGASCLLPPTTPGAALPRKGLYTSATAGAHASEPKPGHLLAAAFFTRGRSLEFSDDGDPRSPQAIAGLRLLQTELQNRNNGRPLGLTLSPRGEPASVKQEVCAHACPQSQLNMVRQHGCVGPTSGASMHGQCTMSRLSLCQQYCRSVQGPVSRLWCSEVCRQVLAPLLTGW